MEVCIKEVIGVPDGSIVSFAADGVCRQAKLPCSRQAMRFPLQPHGSTSLKVDVMTPVGTGYQVIQPKPAQYAVTCSSSSSSTEGLMACIIDVCPSTNTAESNLVAKRGLESDMAYLEEHGLPGFFEALLETLRRAQPKEPYKFLAQQLLADARNREDGLQQDQLLRAASVPTMTAAGSALALVRQKSTESMRGSRASSARPSFDKRSIDLNASLPGDPFSKEFMQTAAAHASAFTADIRSAEQDIQGPDSDSDSDPWEMDPWERSMTNHPKARASTSSANEHQKSEPASAASRKVSVAEAEIAADALRKELAFQLKARATEQKGFAELEMNLVESAAQAEVDAVMKAATCELEVDAMNDELQTRTAMFTAELAAVRVDAGENFASKWIRSDNHQATVNGFRLRNDMLCEQMEAEAAAGALRAAAKRQVMQAAANFGASIVVSASDMLETQAEEHSKTELTAALLETKKGHGIACDSRLDDSSHSSQTTAAPQKVEVGVQTAVPDLPRFTAALAAAQNVESDESMQSSASTVRPWSARKAQSPPPIPCSPRKSSILKTSCKFGDSHSGVEARDRSPIDYASRPSSRASIKEPCYDDEDDDDDGNGDFEDANQNQDHDEDEYEEDSPGREAAGGGSASDSADEEVALLAAAWNSRQVHGARSISPKGGDGIILGTVNLMQRNDSRGQHDFEGSTTPDSDGHHISSGQQLPGSSREDKESRYTKPPPACRPYSAMDSRQPAGRPDSAMQEQRGWTCRMYPAGRPASAMPESATSRNNRREPLSRRGGSPGFSCHATRNRSPARSPEAPFPPSGNRPASSRSPEAFLPHSGSRPASSRSPEASFPHPGSRPTHSPEALRPQSSTGRTGSHTPPTLQAVPELQRCASREVVSPGLMEMQMTDGEWTPGPMEMQMTDLHEYAPYFAEETQYSVDQDGNFTTMDINDQRPASQMSRPPSQMQRISLSPPKRSTPEPQASAAASRQRVQSAGARAHIQHAPHSDQPAENRCRSAEGFHGRRRLPGPHGPAMNVMPAEYHKTEHKILDMNALVANNRKAWESEVITHEQLEAKLAEQSGLAGQDWEWRPDSSSAEKWRPDSTAAETHISRMTPITTRADSVASNISIWTYDFTK
eukprot:gnl/MRDRNA2_/MRDRNA2_31516_c0_seq1.p1 gnl/MRDRNA2_/MRDRNA2_31516_c0~~gnl/MRDRNA2_/MRDRNA2_31516_c0_seq1.p1  ORF type:complete len:1126 (-),score=225.42 gnl/MRDRNA2_/MRDRNA2_31516_c0_seq1:174-3551(-)